MSSIASITAVDDLDRCLSYTWYVSDRSRRHSVDRVAVLVFTRNGHPDIMVLRLAVSWLYADCKLAVSNRKVFFKPGFEPFSR